MIAQEKNAKFLVILIFSQQTNIVILVIITVQIALISKVNAYHVHLISCYTKILVLFYVHQRLINQIENV